MNKIYYTVEKQLDDIDGVGTTNGLADIYLYQIVHNNLFRLGVIHIKTGFYTYEEEISNFIDEFVPEYDSNNIELIKL